MTSTRPSTVNDISCNLEYSEKNIFVFQLENFFNEDEYFVHTGFWLKKFDPCINQSDSLLSVKYTPLQTFQIFKILHELIDKMEDGDEIVFADEYGTWMITGDGKRFVESYLTSLSEISTSEEYIIGAIPLIQRNRWESFSNIILINSTGSIMKQDFNLSINKSKIFFLSFVENGSTAKFDK